jgi:hypothetical protein
MVVLSALALAQNALTPTERRRVLLLYARGLRLLFTARSPRQITAQWVEAWEAVFGELLALVLTRHRRLSETVQMMLHHFLSHPPQGSRAQLEALYQVMARQLDAEVRGALRLLHMGETPGRRQPRQRTAQRARRRRAHRK